MSVGKKVLPRKVETSGRALWLLVLLFFGLAGCFLKPAPPPTRIDRTASLYPEPRDQGCAVELLTSPPPVPHKAFAQITVRGDKSQVARMEERVKEEACSLGADAVITFTDMSKVRIYQDSYPDWVDREPHTMIKDYPFSLIGIAIVYKDAAKR